MDTDTLVEFKQFYTDFKSGKGNGSKGQINEMPVVASGHLAHLTGRVVSKEEVLAKYKPFGAFTFDGNEINIFANSDSIFAAFVKGDSFHIFFRILYASHQLINQE